MLGSIHEMRGHISRSLLPEIETDDEQPHNPERNLVVAVIRRAISDLAGNKNERKDARIWLFHGKSKRIPFSFRWCCRELDWNVNAIRRALKSTEPKEIRRRLQFGTQNRVLSDAA